MNLTLQQCLEATGGRLIFGEPTFTAGELNTDSRQIKAGQTFLALVGEKFNGHDFLPQALAQGATGLIISQSDFAPSLLARAKWVLLVSDTTAALGQIARHWKNLVAPNVVAVTGSCGKTTVKEMTAHICREFFRVHATPGNFNNEIGLPLTLLQLQREHSLAVCEVGMNHSGELTRLTEICEPNIAVITNVGDAHLGNFSSKEALRNAKAELFHASPLNTTLILGTDCPNASLVANDDLKGRKLITFGTSAEADVRATCIQTIGPEEIHFTLEYGDSSVPVALKLFGQHQIQNSLAAAAVALQLGVKLEQIAQRLQTFRSSNQRSVLKNIGGMTIVEDCYNASPTAVIQALRSLKQQFPDKRLIGVLGEMQELGTYSETLHRKVARECVAQKLNFVFAVGEKARWYKEEISVFSSIPTLHVEHVDHLAGSVIPFLEEDDVVIVKGSRTNKLEIFISALEANYNGTESAVS